jgi:hypothetical protein
VFLSDSRRQAAPLRSQRRSTGRCPDWKAGHQVRLGPARTLRIVAVRDEDADQPPVDRGRRPIRFSSCFKARWGRALVVTNATLGCGNRKVAPTRPHLAKVPGPGNPFHENGRGTLVSALAAGSAVAVCRSQPLPRLDHALSMSTAKRRYPRRPPVPPRGEVGPRGVCLALSQPTPSCGSRGRRHRPHQLCVRQRPSFSSNSRSAHSGQIPLKRTLLKPATGQGISRALLGSTGATSSQTAARHERWGPDCQTEGEGERRQRTCGK